MRNLVAHGNHSTFQVLWAQKYGCQLENTNLYYPLDESVLLLFFRCWPSQ